MIGVFKNYLETRGIKPIDERTNTITFSSDNLNFLFICDIDDPYYFRLVLPNVVDIQDDKKNEFIDIIFDCNERIKAAKGIVVNDRIWISIEQFVYSKEHINELFGRVYNVAKAYYNLLTDSVKDKILQKQ